MNCKIIISTCGNTKEKKTISNFTDNNLGKITICKLPIFEHTSLSYYLSSYFEIKCTQENQHSITGFIFCFLSKIDYEFLNPAKFYKHTHTHTTYRHVSTALRVIISGLHHISANYLTLILRTGIHP